MRNLSVISDTGHLPGFVVFGWKCGVLPPVVCISTLLVGIVWMKKNENVLSLEDVAGKRPQTLTRAETIVFAGCRREGGT